MTEIEYFQDGNILMEKWIQNGKLHRVDGPAKIEYFWNGQIWREKWYHQGKLHRVDGPASIEYYPNGKVEREQWYQNGFIFREGGPSFISYFENGNLECQDWLYKPFFYDRRHHRVDGPAYISFNIEGNILETEFYLNGKFLTEDNFYKILFILKRPIKALKKKKRDNLLSQLKNSDICFTNGPDICRYITTFVY